MTEFPARKMVHRDDGPSRKLGASHLGGVSAMSSRGERVRSPWTGTAVESPASIAVAEGAPEAGIRPTVVARGGRRRAVLDRLIAGEPVVRRIALCVLLYSLPLIALRQAVLDPDIWWHLRTGQWIVEHGRVPATDPFSTFGHERAWVAYSWLFEVVVFGISRGSGLLGIWIFRAAMVYAVAVALHRLLAGREPRFVRVAGLLAVAYVALLGIDTERPWHFTVLFSILTVAVIEEVRSGRRPWWLWWLPPVFALWASLHVQFVMGLGLLALATICGFIGDYRARMSGRPDQPAGGPILLALLVACLLATGINPYGFGVYRPVIEYGGHSFVFNYIQEHRAPEFRSLNDWCLVGLAGAAAFTLGRRRWREPYLMALLAVATYFAFHSRRDGWFLVIAALVALTSRPPKSCPTLERFTYTWPRAVVVGSLVGSLLAFTAWWNDLGARGLHQAVERAYPEQAAAYLEDNLPPGPIYNHLNWGGYLIWRLPAYPVTIDGRTNLHGDERIERSERTWSGRGDRWSDPEFQAARIIVADRTTALAAIVRLDPKFELLHEDAVAVVFRSRADGESRLSRRTAEPRGGWSHPR